MRAIYVALARTNSALTTKTIHEEGGLTIVIDAAPTGQVVGVEILTDAIGRVTIE